MPTPYRARPLLVAGSIAVALAGCATDTRPIDPRARGVMSDISAASDAPVSGQDAVADAAFWSTRYERNPNDVDVALKFSEALRRIGSVEEAIKVSERTVQIASGNPGAQLEYGKSLLAADRAYEAEAPLRAAVEAQPRDWRALSALGVALDMTGDHRAARIQYDRALALAPNEPRVLNNKAMSLALSGKLVDAEALMRSAAATPGSTSRVRQNLALILAFKGDLKEAERLARADLPPKTAANNIAYYQSIAASPLYWRSLEGDEFEAPDFDAGDEDPSPRDRAEARRVIESAADAAKPIVFQPAEAPSSGAVRPRNASAYEAPAALPVESIELEPVDDDE